MQTAEEKRAYWRAHYHANKEAWRAKRRRYELSLRALILTSKDRPCADCGRHWHPLVMEHDHRPGETKLFNIGDWFKKRLVGKGKLLEEIAKCDVLCPTCHRIRTLKRLGKI